MMRTQRMGKKPFHRRTRYAARSLIALTTALALIVAPLVVILTHGPAAQATAAPITAEITAHGHDHDHGHTHDDPERDGQGGLFGGHSPADHDHQLTALICQPTNAHSPPPDKDHCALSDVFRHLTLEGPIRPPRSV